MNTENKQINQDDLKRLKQIEHKLQKMVAVTKTSWVEAYKLLHEVREKSLWATKHRSFTAWVKDFAIRNNTHESIIWRINKAGKTYESYQSIQQSKGIEVPAIEDSKVPIESLELISKIAMTDGKTNKPKDEATLVKLIDQSQNGGLTRDNLREAWKSVRAARNTSAKLNTNISNATPEEVEHIENSVNEDSIKALDIVNSLNNADWLSKRRTAANDYYMPKYTIMTEFAVQTGTSRKSRRIDVLAVETVTKKNTLLLHGIEIKVDINDLRNDKKYTEYAEFVDYIYLAIPSELLEEAETLAPETVGIIVVSDGKAKIRRKPQKLEPLKRQATLELALYKSM